MLVLVVLLVARGLMAMRMTIIVIIVEQAQRVPPATVIVIHTGQVTRLGWIRELGFGWFRQIGIGQCRTTKSHTHCDQ